MKYRRKDIDGLRAIAVISVLIFHAWPESYQGGFTGVDVFFVISGFLITSKITHGLDRGSFSFILFSCNRIKRLVPPLLAVLIAPLIVGIFYLFPNEYYALCKETIAGISFTSNYYFWSLGGYFDTKSELKPLLHLWSLGVEEQFYLIWPLCLLLIAKLKRNRVTFIVLILLISFFSSILETFQASSIAFYWLPTRMWELMLGALISQRNFCKRTGGSEEIFKNLCSVIGLVLICTSFLITPKASFPGFYALLPTLGTALSILSGEKSVINRIVLSNRVFVVIGLISYSLYLWHWPMLSFLYIVEGIPSDLLKLIALALSFALAGLSYVLIERPFAKMSFNNSPKRGILLVAPVVCSGIFIACISYLIDSGKIEIKSFSAFVTQVSDLSRVPLEPVQNPNLLIIGDSHASHFSSGANKFKNKMSVDIRSIVGAAALKGVVTEHDKRSAIHPIDKILDRTMTAKFVVLSARIARNLEQSRNSAEDNTPFVTTFFDISEGRRIAPAEAMYRGYKRTIESVIQHGKQPIILMQVPPPYQHSSSCLRRRKFSLNRCKNAPLEDVKRRFLSSNKLIARLKLDFSDLWVYDPVKDLCNEKGCLFKIDNRLIYRDDNHLGNFGSEYVWEKFLIWLEHEKKKG